MIFGKYKRLKQKYEKLDKRFDNLSSVVASERKWKIKIKYICEQLKKLDNVYVKEKSRYKKINTIEEIINYIESWENKMKIYYSLNKLMGEIGNIKNETICISKELETVISKTNIFIYKSLKKIIHNNNIKVKVWGGKNNMDKEELNMVITTEEIID